MHASGPNVHAKQPKANYLGSLVFVAECINAAHSAETIRVQVGWDKPRE